MFITRNQILVEVSRERLSNLKAAQIRLAEYCQQLKRNLENASYQEKREILDMLAIRVTATTESVDIQGVMPLEDTSIQSSDGETSLLTTGRTWASLFHCRYSYIEGRGYALLVT